MNKGPETKTHQNDDDEEAVHDVLEPVAGDGVDRPFQDGDGLSDGRHPLVTTLSTQQTPELGTALKVREKTPRDTSAIMETSILGTLDKQKISLSYMKIRGQGSNAEH